MDPCTITFTGTLHDVGDIHKLDSGIQCQRVIFAIHYNDPRMKTDYIAVFSYGPDVWRMWENYNDKDQPKSATVTAKLVGRMNAKRNTLTLNFKKIIWNQI